MLLLAPEYQAHGIITQNYSELQHYHYIIR
jgi:hypothetical protein